MYCSVCRNGLLTHVKLIPGYVKGDKYDVWNCNNCNSQSSTTSLNTNYRDFNSLYDAIYSRGKSLGGYCRYYRYKKIALKSSNPLKALSRSEDMYFAVRSILKHEPNESCIVEVASGLGYLTKALRSDGRSAFGTDISEVAVREARKSFGPYFFTSDATGDVSWKIPKPDVIIALELIEHVSDPYLLIESLLKRMKSSGKLIISTPNRDLFSSDSIWGTDPPPVHLFWFSENGLKMIADNLGLKIEFFNFYNFNRFTRVSRTTVKKQILSQSFLDESYNVINKISSFRNWLLSTRIAPIIIFAHRYIFKRNIYSRERSATLVAIIRNKE